MTLRDTRIGRWARKHDRTHRLIHATWCRAIGPFDTKRVASSNGSITGGGSTTGADYLVIYPPFTVNAGLKYQTATLSDAVAWAKANCPVGIAYTIYQQGGGLVYSGTGSQTGAQATQP